MGARQGSSKAGRGAGGGSGARAGSGAGFGGLLSASGQGRGGGGGGGGEDYWTLSSRPLHTLIFLVPFIGCYAVGSMYYLTDSATGVRQNIRAEKLLNGFFELFGSAGLVVPGLAIIAVLLAWHVVSRDAWRVRPLVLVGMVLEAALWSLPLLVFGALMQRMGQGAGGLEAMSVAPVLWQSGWGGVGGVSGGGEMLPAAAATIADLSWQARVSIALGAGLYEELLFRLVAIALLHFVMRDALKSGEGAARAVAVIGSALAFALYHDQVFVPAGAPGFAGMNPHTLVFYTLAGIYFACLYLFRGFGIVVAAHAIYDVFVLVVLAEPRA